VSKLASAIHVATHPVELPGRVAITLLSWRELRQTVYRYVDWRDTRGRKRTDYAHVRLPPASLRYRVHGDLNRDSFLETGHQCSQDIQAALACIGRTLTSFRDVLDFGCGCGRTLLWLRDVTASSRLFGTDIDAEAIAWCRQNIDFASFATNGALPPLEYPDESFDLVYAISVFTHLDENQQFRWLEELRRVTRAGGYLLLTVHGAFQQRMMSAREVARLRASGFVFTELPSFMQGIFPDWYQTTAHTREYVHSRFSTYFKVVEYLPNSLDHCQDIVILEKPR
jgi:SAM-dependent methyltransferase